MIRISNVQFTLNVSSIGGGPTSQINAGRVSGSNESDDFWVAYVQIGYQGPIITDRDPDIDQSLIDPGTTLGITPVYGLTDSIPSNCSQTPRGGDGSLVFLESIKDDARYRSSTDDSGTVPHEVGHQFGLKGDVNGYKLMGDVGEELIFVPAHLHIIRCRIKSPGQP